MDIDGEIEILKRKLNIKQWEKRKKQIEEELLMIEENKNKALDELEKLENGGELNGG